MSNLAIIHWNDVYRVAPQKINPKSKETIDVTQFGALMDGIREKWAQLPDGKKDGLVLFSGDVFSPSVESSVTRGSHMVKLEFLSARCTQTILILITGPCHE
jgi:5'-nucleotidase